MNFRNWFESVQRKYYHATNKNFPIGFILLPNPEYQQKWEKTDFYSVLEKHRPPHMLRHANAVFMVDDLETIDATGAPINYIYEVQPLGPVQQHDLNWSHEISMLLDLGGTPEEIAKAAENYWNGVPHYNETAWEFLTTSARIVALVEENPS